MSEYSTKNRCLTVFLARQRSPLKYRVDGLNRLDRLADATCGVADHQHARRLRRERRIQQHTTNRSSDW
jgi:hypothetical protein